MVGRTFGFYIPIFRLVIHQRPDIDVFPHRTMLAVRFAIAGVRTRWRSSSHSLPICFDLTAGHIHHVTQKEIVLDAISELPDEVSLGEIAERIEFLAAIQKGMDQLDRGEGIPHEEVKRQLAAWLAS